MWKCGNVKKVQYLLNKDLNVQVSDTTKPDSNNKVKYKKIKNKNQRSEILKS